MKKRATPLEKIMSKIIKIDQEDDEDTPRFRNEEFNVTKKEST